MFSKDSFGSKYTHKDYEYNKEEDNIMNTLNVRNYQASSKKFKQYPAKD